jgi:hypothetical protein
MAALAKAAARIYVLMVVPFGLLNDPPPDKNPEPDEHAQVPEGIGKGLG